MLLESHHLISCTWCPRPRRGLSGSSVVLSPMCLNTKMTRDLVLTPKEKVFRRIALTPIWRVSAPRHLALYCSELPFGPWRPRSREAPPRLPSRCLNAKVVGSFLTEPRYLFLAFLYIVIRKTYDNVCLNWFLLG